eukprot:5200341-Pyramimonas_sp.AAC.1
MDRGGKDARVPLGTLPVQTMRVDCRRGLRRADPSEERPAHALYTRQVLAAIGRRKRRRRRRRRR